MELLLLKAQETAHLATNMHTRLNEYTNTLTEQLKLNEEILEEALRIANELLPELDEDGEQNLSKLLRLIEIIVVHKVTNFRDALEILDWSSGMAAKYAIEYKRLIQNYGYDLN
jgi:uncharacterized protein YicC (UPF0701 family)